MSTLELKVYDILKSKFTEAEAATVIEYFEAKAKEKIDGGGEDCIQEYSDLRHEYKNLINRVEKGRKLRGKIEAQGPNELSSIANLMKKRTRGESKLIKKIKKGGL